MNTILIIGGGASGMAAALAARERLDCRVVLLERQSRVGRKLLATGNGRCNLTNRSAAPGRYHGENAAFAVPALERFGVDDTLSWFSSLGLRTRTEAGSGRVYPLSDAAASVVDTLRLALEARGVETRCGFEASRVTRTETGFAVEAAPGGSRDGSDRGDTIRGDRLIVACGGLAGTRLGGTKSGYELLESLGHRRTRLCPALVQLRTDNAWTRAMKGVRTQAALTLTQGGGVIARAAGEVQFTDYGVSGPAVFDLSRAAAAAGDGCVLTLRLLPELAEDDIMQYLTAKQAVFPNYKAEYLFTGALHNAIARVLLRRTGISPEAYLWALDESALSRLADAAVRFTLPVTGTMGFDGAQVTAGGVRTDGFDPATMESRLVPGLYACGEVLDIDGDCGGFNLQWAWSSGRLAGTSAARTEDGP